MKARFLLGPGGGRRGPHQVGVGRGLYQPAEDRLRPKLRPAARRKLWCCWGSCSRRPSCSSCRGRPRRWRGGGADDGACRLGVCCGHPAAAAEELGDHKARSARGLRASGGLRPGRHAAAGYRRRRCAGRGGGRALLAGAGHGFPDPRGFVCRVGVVRLDQPVATDRGFRQPYPPECVECVLRTSPIR